MPKVRKPNVLRGLSQKSKREIAKYSDAITMNRVTHQLSKNMAPHTKSGDGGPTFLIKKVARKSQTCKICGIEIRLNQEYYSEAVVSIGQGPPIHFSSYCLNCGESSGLQIRLIRYRD